MISLGRCDIKMLLQATDDVAQRAFAVFRRGCARIATGHLPGGAHAVVVIRNDRDVHRAVAARGRAQLRQNQGLELRFVFGSFSGFVLGDSSVMVPFFEIAMRQRLNAGAFFCACRTPVARAVRKSTSAERAVQERVRSKLRTWAAAPDGARAPAFSASGSSLRAEPVSWQPCARVGWLPPSRGSCARTVFHTPCGASSREKRPRVASSF